LAQCDEGTIVMAAAGFKRVRLACLKPTTGEQCEALLDQISLAGRSAVADQREAAVVARFTLPHACAEATRSDA
jgi:hypothetical protein